MKNKVVVFWFRRDLRLEDNTGLSEALASGYPVLPVFIFDTEILGQLENPYDRRVDYIHQALTAINKELHDRGASLHACHGTPKECFKALLDQYEIQAVYSNRDYEPQAISRDLEISIFLKERSIPFYDFKDQVIFEQSDIVKPDGNPYTIYTPYSNKWRSTLQTEQLSPRNTNQGSFVTSDGTIPTLEEVGFQKTDLEFRQPELNLSIIRGIISLLIEVFFSNGTNSGIPQIIK